METTAGTLQKRGRAAAKKAKRAINKVRNDAVPMLKRMSGHAWQGVEQGLEAIDDTAQQARDVSKKASKSIVAYTRKKPVKALAIAAASGILLHAAVKAFKPARDKQPAARKARA
jgi:ElaB/YqjD/DUF883 family membrane-anchored ribosome-binding protein